MDRIDAFDKASGVTIYVADVSLPNMCHAVIVRSTEPHARIAKIDAQSARACPGVVGVFTAGDVSDKPFGRYTRDIPVLARDKVHFVGERVAAVVAETRAQAEFAASLVIVEYESLPAVTTPQEALSPGAALVHEQPWTYPNAHVGKDDPHKNIQAIADKGDREEAEAALSNAAFVVDEVYSTSSIHQGYLETQASVAAIDGSGHVRLWCTNKSPYLLANQIGECLDIDPGAISVQPAALGGDFGGKGSPGDAPLCIELARLTKRPVKIVLKYAEDLTATNPRHPASVRVRLGADKDGRLQGVLVESLVNGGSFAGYKPGVLGVPLGLMAAPGYSLPTFYSEVVVCYTNTVSRGNMRAPGSPQFAFAFESAMDELAALVGFSPLELRRRNVLHTGDQAVDGHTWVEYRGEKTLDAASAAVEEVEAPPGWLVGQGISMVARADHANPLKLSVRISPQSDGGVIVELSSVETGTGSHTVMRKVIADRLGIPLEKVSISQVPTDELGSGLTAGGSQVTVAMAGAADIIATEWAGRSGTEPITVEVALRTDTPPVGTVTTQIATVAVDPETGQVKVLEILSAVDVAQVINERAHQMQVDGGTLMGFGMACLEDLDESDGQVWAANLGEFKLASERDAPHLRTVLVKGGRGVGDTGVKQIGESTTPPTPAAIANAVFAATGARIRELPITAERVYEAMHR